MTQTSLLNPHPVEYEPFLHATVGTDRNGAAVTVLSTLARLGLDPWHETAELVRLGRDEAHERLGRLLAKFWDVPALGRDHARVARDLAMLLPERTRAGGLARTGAAQGGSLPRRIGAGPVIWALLALVFVVVQIMSSGMLGSGE